MNDNERLVGEGPAKDICSSQYMKLWILEFEVNGAKGCAVVKAANANSASRLLVSSGMYNGTPEAYKIGRIEQIELSPEQMLVCEQINN